MNRTKHAIKQLYGYLRKHPFRAGLIGLCLVVVGGLPLFFMPKTVHFSYADKTCAKELTLLPSLHSQRGGSGYEVQFDDIRTIGALPLASTAVCFVPTEAPSQGDVSLATSLWGSWLAPQSYNLTVGAEPKVNAAAFSLAIPTTKPLSVDLDQPDSLHQYHLNVDKKSTPCSDKGATLNCDITSMKLSQGKTYGYELTKKFNQQAEVVSKGDLKTLRAVKVVKSDIKNQQTVYGKPTKLRLTLDKPIQSAEANLTAGDSEEVVDVSVTGKVVTVAWDKQLKRQTDYIVTLDDVEAEDGSTLIDPYKVSFTMSGGPKVAGISIGSSRVEPNAQAIITFDQELSAKQEIASLVKFEGGTATVTRLGARQVSVQLSELGRCVPFTISVAPGAISKYDIKSQDDWSFSSRTLCYTTSVYGTSLQGRPLIAYYFGNSGPVTLYTGAIHGNEVSSKYLMDSWIAELEANPDKIGKRRIVVIPSINPDGVAAGTRNNSRDVNLSRNFPTSNWVKDIDDTDGPNKGGGGAKPLSEPEAAALARISQAVSPRLLVSYHAVGSLVVGDPGGYSAARAARYASLVGYLNATGQGGTFDYDITGSYEDWTYRNAGIPSMIVELGSYSYHNFAQHRSAMWAMLE